MLVVVSILGLFVPLTGLEPSGDIQLAVRPYRHGAEAWITRNPHRRLETCAAVDRTGETLVIARFAPVDVNMTIADSAATVYYDLAFIAASSVGEYRVLPTASAVGRLDDLNVFDKDALLVEM